MKIRFMPTSTAREARDRILQLTPSHPMGAKEWHQMPCPFSPLWCSDKVLSLFNQEDVELFTEQVVAMITQLRAAIDQKLIVKSPGTLHLEWPLPGKGRCRVELMVHIHASHNLKTCLLLVLPGEDIHC